MVIETTASAVSSRDAITGHAGTSSPEDVGHAQRTTRQKESAIMERETDTQTVRNGEIAQQDYEFNARLIAERMGLTVVAAFKGDRCPKWGATDASRSRSGCACDQIHGDRYRVTLKWEARRDQGGEWLDRDARQRLGSLSFDFWASQHDQETGKRPSYYDILSCVSSEASSPTDPDEVVEEYGEMKPSQAIAVAKHAAKLQAFFTEAELTALSEIR